MASVSAFRYQSDANNDVSQAADLESERAYKDLIHLPEYITAEAWSASDAYSQTTLQAVYI